MAIQKIEIGDCRDIIKKYTDNFFSCLVTSPPYYRMRDYHTTPLIYGSKKDCNHQWVEKIHKCEGGTATESTTVGANMNDEENNRGGEGVKYWLCSQCSAFKGELGWEETPEMFCRDLIEVFETIRPKIKENGSIWVNLGDKWIDLDQQLIPEQFALGMKKKGWILINKVTWIKPNAMPGSQKRRLTKTSELIFHFVKNPDYWYDLDAIRVPHKTQSLERYQRAVDLGVFAETSKYGNRQLMGMPQHAPKWFVEGANTGINNKEPYQENNPHRTRLYEGKFDGMGKGSEQYGSPRARNERNSDSKFLKSDQKTASPGARAILSERDGKLTTFVRTKLQECGQHLKEKLKQSSYTIEQLAEIIDIKETTLAHYFRTDLMGQAIPDRNTWEALQELIGIGNYEDFVSEEIRNALPQSHPLGKNPGDTWEINTESFHGAHFAVFPLSLVKIPILSCCPLYVCKKCGKPRERITQSITLDRTATDGCGNGELADGNFGSSIHEQVGWSSCSCGVEFDAGWVLDPFAGSGTTLEFCRDNNRNAVGIELNPAYKPLSVKRARLDEPNVTPMARTEVL